MDSSSFELPSRYRGHGRIPSLDRASHRLTPDREGGIPLVYSRAIFTMVAGSVNGCRPIAAGDGGPCTTHLSSVMSRISSGGTVRSEKGTDVFLGVERILLRYEIGEHLGYRHVNAANPLRRTTLFAVKQA